ncbi:MAG: undecaprenyldiphospho-muramoylpentapeptide beta-N-acetylglucosaminyltransferase [Acidimicrobiia bacterium]|nr:undecaprenyldiphospho-muramoylpentapeptide beta-N-acetylglucosaminyltransferase [Acidimicrobiia bacterium]
MSRSPSTTYAVIAGGGTAGHVLPGLAIARALVARGHDPVSIHFVGSERGLEARLVPEAGFTLTTLPGRGLERRISVGNVRTAMALAVATARAIKLVRRRRPSVVVSLGGYAAVPCIVAAVLWRVPLVVAEQNARAGSANRLAGRFAAACAVPVPATDLPRAVVTGNPVRSEILAVDRHTDGQTARAALGVPDGRILVAAFSGSLGARRINRAMLDLVARWADRTDVAVYHVCGQRDHEELQADLPEVGELWYRLVPYEDHMERLLAAADIGISRAGGTTVAELAEVGLPAILVPLPIAPRDHQTANADALVEAGGAILLADGDCDGRELERLLAPLVDEPDRLRAMSRAAHSLARPAAAEDLAALVDRVAAGGDSTSPRDDSDGQESAP